MCATRRACWRGRDLTAAAALLMAAIGVYGMMAYTVSARRPD